MQVKSLSFISDLEKFGRKMKDNLYEVGITDLTPVHDIFPALSFCSCQRNCKSILCKCEKKKQSYVYRNMLPYESRKSLTKKELHFDLQDDHFGVSKRCQNIAFITTSIFHYLESKWSMFCFAKNFTVFLKGTVMQIEKALIFYDSITEKQEQLRMPKFQCLLFVLTRSYICYYIICMTVPLAYFSLIFHSHTPSTRQKAFGFPAFSRGMKMEYSVKMGLFWHWFSCFAW